MSNIDDLLNRVEQRIERQIDQTNKEVAMFIRDDARNRCPVDTGELRNSITSEVKDGNISVFTNMEYGPYVEYGTGQVGQETNKRPGINYRKNAWCYVDDDGNFIWTKGQKAQPFMYPALHDNKKQIVKKYKNDLKNALRGV